MSKIKHLQDKYEEEVMAQTEDLTEDEDCLPPPSDNFGDYHDGNGMYWDSPDDGVF